MHPGIEIPLQECPEGLEWALVPSSMVGTKIGFSHESNEVYIRIVDSVREQVEQSFVSGEKRLMTRVGKPSWLLDATAAAATYTRRLPRVVSACLVPLCTIGNQKRRPTVFRRISDTS